MRIDNHLHPLSGVTRTSWHFKSFANRLFRRQYINANYKEIKTKSMKGIRQWSLDSPHNWPVMKAVPYDDAIIFRGSFRNRPDVQNRIQRAESVWWSQLVKWSMNLWISYPKQATRFEEIGPEKGFWLVIFVPFNPHIFNIADPKQIRQYVLHGKRICHA